MAEPQCKETHIHPRASAYLGDWFREAPCTRGEGSEKLKAYLTLTAGCALSPAFRAMAHFLFPKKVKAIHSHLTKLLEPGKHEQRESIPSTVYRALVAAEDSRFLAHRGFDMSAVLRALWQQIRFGTLQGGSTIEQQLVRTLTASYRRTYRRKVTEIILSASVQEGIGKHQVLEAYLRIAHFGWGMDGISRATRVLGYDLSDIRPVEAAGLVARLRYPEPRIRNVAWVHLIERRTQYILRRMYAGTRYSHSPGYSWKGNEAVSVQRVS